MCAFDSETLRARSLTNLFHRHVYLQSLSFRTPWRFLHLNLLLPPAEMGQRGETKRGHKLTPQRAILHLEGRMAIEISLIVKIR